MKIKLTETVLRDANQSLIATRLPYDKFEGILTEMDKCGYYSVECGAERRSIRACASWTRIPGNALER
jgi:pyruvate/oxaloacetate carboxyltransferase